MLRTPPPTILEVPFMKFILWIVLLAFSTQLFAQSAVPAGTILPVALSSSLNSRKSKVGQVITAQIMQNVPLDAGSRLRAGIKVMGHVVEVNPADHTHGATMSIRFDTLVVPKRRIPITTNIRALASMMAVHEAQLPETGPDRGTSENAWTTDQIGGDVVYQGGPVANGLQVVGTPTADGVLVRIASKPGTKCRGDLSGNDHPQALWVFSADACGTYGFSDLTVIHAGRSNPIGQITLVSERGNIDIRGGSGLLLRVQAVGIGAP